MARSRNERLGLKTHRQLRCEWCGKWTPVRGFIYSSLIEHDYKKKRIPPREAMPKKRKIVYYCGRPKCKLNRRGMGLQSDLLEVFFDDYNPADYSRPIRTASYD